jgi:WD40 repeat protein
MQNILSIDTKSIFKDGIDVAYMRQLENIVWNPHQPEVVTVGGNNLSGWDLRSGKTSFQRDEAHKSTIRAVDYNPNKPYHIVTGGDDALVHIWDARHLKEPLINIESHTHWVWSVAFNQLQDQLLLSSGSDTLVNLHNTISVSSASYLEDSSDDDDDVPEDSERKT